MASALSHQPLPSGRKQYPERNPVERRYVMTTRSDGDMILNVALNGIWTLVPVKVQDWNLRPQRALPMAGLGQLGSLGLLAR
jgi:hypothetical protein